MRVCLISRYFDFRNAGIGRVGMELEKGLAKRGHSVLRVSTNGNSLYSYFFYTLCEIPFRLPKTDVYHALTPMEGMWLPKERSMVTFHDLIQMLSPEKLGSGMGYSRWKRFVGMHYNKFVIKRGRDCKKVVAVSEETRDNLIKHLGVPSEKVTVITSGIGPELLPLRKRDEKIKRIGYLGQLDKRKRIDLLIRAFRRSDLQSELLIGGTGFDERLLKEQARGDDRIKFLGLVRDSDLVEFYNSTDVFIFPTCAEGYGLPIVEAMACKRPVVVLSDAEIPWEVKRRCIIVDNLEVLFGNQKYLEERCLYNNCEENYEWAKSHDWDKTIDKYIELYEEVISD